MLIIRTDCFDKQVDGVYKGCLPIDWFGTEGSCLEETETLNDKRFEYVELKLILSDGPISGNVECKGNKCVMT